MKVLSPQPIMTQRAAEEIRTAILNGSLAPGTRVRQEELASKLGVSREPIRKALLVLEREGLVRSVANRGAVIAPVDPSLIREIYEFREAVESYIVAKIAELKDFDPTPLQKIIAQGRKAIRAGVLNRLIELDLAFHAELYRASGNRVVMEVMHTQWNQIRRAMLPVLARKGYRKQVWDEHEAIVEAITKGQSSRAASLAAAHTKGARGWLTPDADESTTAASN